MKNTRYCFETLCIYDYRGVENHLSAMAARGWRLEKAGNTLWKYRRAERANVRYAVTYSAGASQFNPGPTQGQQSLAELCGAAGWEKVCDWFQMQIFCSEDLSAVPLETDEALRLENIHRSMRKNFLPANIVLLVIGLLMSISFLGTLFVNPLHVFERNISLLTGPLFVLVTLLEIYTLFHYYSWRQRSRRSIEEGGSCAPVNTQGYQRLNRGGLVLVGIFVALYLLMELLTGNRGMVLFYIIYALLLFLLAFLVRRTTALLRSWGVSKEWNLVGTLIVDVILAFALIGGLAYGVIHYGWFFSIGAGGTYEYQGSEWDANPREDVPLTLSELTGTDYRHVRRRVFNEGSFFIPHYRCWETVLLEGGPVPYNLKYLTYEIWVPKLSWLREALVKDRLEAAELRISEIPGFRKTRRYEAEDPSSWGAEAAYRQYLDDIPLDIWLLVWPDRVALVEVDGPTPEQKAVIRARLGPEA